MKFTKLLIALLPLTLVIGNAHPGHGLMEHGAGHVATSAFHLLVLTGFAFTMLAVAQIVRNGRARKFLRVAGGGALVTAGVLWGLGI